MSFTEDELQAFHSVLAERFAVHEQAMTQAIDQRLDALRQEIDQRFVHFQQDMLTSFEQGRADSTENTRTTIEEKLGEHRQQITQILDQEGEQRTQQIEASVDRLLAAQLLGIEQLLHQQATSFPLAENNGTVSSSEVEAVEVQTDLSWEDLAEIIGKALDERLVTLNDTLRQSVKNLEHYLTGRLLGLRDELTHLQDSKQVYSGSILGQGTSLQEVLSGIEHLEHVIESMQVAMTANHALLSNRLYHHQQLPLERAHPGGQIHVTPANNVGSLLTQAKERIASGLEPELPSRPDARKEMNEAEEH